MQEKAMSSEKPKCPICRNLSGFYSSLQGIPVTTLFENASQCASCEFLYRVANACPEEAGFIPDGVSFRFETRGRFDAMGTNDITVVAGKGKASQREIFGVHATLPTNDLLYAGLEEREAAHPLAYQGWGPVAQKLPLRLRVQRKVPLDVLKAWHRACLFSHELCSARARSVDRSNAPTRLLYIEGHEELRTRVVFTPKLTPDYAALSYRWGRTSTLVLTKINVASLTNPIDPSRLGKTILDACIVTRELGLSYLWVDALCILQDDIDDWREESSKMGQIYSGSSLVINAARAEDVEAGFLGLRPGSGIIVQSGEPSPSMGTTHDFLLFPTNTGLRKGQAHTLPYGHEGNVPAGLEEHKVFSRAWCLQEQLLGLRIIHFTSEEMIWECAQDPRCECLGFVKDSQSRTVEAEYKSWLRLKDTYQSTDATTLDVVEAGSRWWTCVENYSARQLTRPEDVLAAIAGLASKMRRHSLGKYLSGMWETCLPSDLLWHRPDYGMRRKRPRSSEFQGPSWSWISIMGKVARPLAQQDETSSYKVRGPDCRLAELIAYEPLDESSSSLIQSRDITLHLRAPMRHVEARIKFTNPYPKTGPSQPEWWLWDVKLRNSSSESFWKIRGGNLGAFDAEIAGVYFSDHGVDFGPDESELNSRLSAVNLQAVAISAGKVVGFEDEDGEISEMTRVGVLLVVPSNRVLNAFERVGVVYKICEADWQPLEDEWPLTDCALV